MRQANHHTYLVREVTDLYPVLGAVHALFSRCDQLAGYLQHTTQHADPSDFRHTQAGEVSTELAALHDGLVEARALLDGATRQIGAAWSSLGLLALETNGLICPECGEPAYRGIPTDLTPAQRAAATRPRYRHADGTQLCPVLGETGYEPATPIRPGPAGTSSSGSTTDPQ
jgi:hypothetical protein